MNYPIAEIFTSVQGEGAWAGARMTFVRLAGCTVGKPYPKTNSVFKMLESYQEKCTLWDGREFPCDTNYKKTALMTTAQIMTEVGDELRICITGGEPLMHDLQPLIKALHGSGKVIHLETSGTIDLKDIRSQVDWIAVSPKLGALKTAIMAADEVKILVDERFDEQRFEEILDCVPSARLWFQPINALKSVDEGNLVRCMNLQAKHKNVRISIQLHKWMGVR